MKTNPEKKIEINSYMIKNADNIMLFTAKSTGYSRFLNQSWVKTNRIITIGNEVDISIANDLSLAEQAKINRIEITIQP